MKRHIYRIKRLSWTSSRICKSCRSGRCQPPRKIRLPSKVMIQLISSSLMDAIFYQVEDSFLGMLFCMSWPQWGAFTDPKIDEDKRKWQVWETPPVKTASFPQFSAIQEMSVLCKNTNRDSNHLIWRQLREKKYQIEIQLSAHLIISIQE